jgi:hypothetical protein
MVALAAPPADADVQIIGAGLSACWTWTADRAARTYPEVGDEQWVVGFLSAVAVWAPNLEPLQGVDAEAVFSWMDTYCRAHPLVILGEAAKAFVQEHPDRGSRPQRAESDAKES